MDKCNHIIGTDAVPYEGMGFLYADDWTPADRNPDIEYTFFKFCPLCGVALPETLSVAQAPAVQKAIGAATCCGDAPRIGSSRLCSGIIIDCLKCGRTFQYSPTTPMAPFVMIMAAIKEWNRIKKQ